MAGNWTDNVKFIQDGERVDANISGRPDRSLADRTVYLKDRIDAIDNGQATFAFDVAVDETVVVGNAVYWNVANQRFEKALAEVYSTTNGSFETTSRTEVVGVVYSKASATVATLVLSGKVSLDISPAVVGSVTPGRYYLSGQEAGKILKQSPGLSISVLYADGNGVVYVSIQSKNLLEAHVHYKAELYMKPAGTATVQNVNGADRAVITSPDPDLMGWLPADHEVFNGLAPYGSAFGYNLDKDTKLAPLWPPLPESSASLTVFMDLEIGAALQNFGLEVPTGPNGLVIVDRNGIWWMSNCNGEAPWQEYYSSSSVQSATSYPECPRNAESKLVLYFSKVRYGNDSSVVTSIRPYNDATPIRVVDQDGNNVTAGDVILKFDSTYQIDQENVSGSLALKNIVNNKFKRGYVTEGLIAADDSVVITSTHSFVNGDSDTVHQGVVSIRADVEGLERFITPQVVRVIDAKERYESEIMYLGFQAEKTSSVRYKFRMPGASNFPTNPRIKLRLWLYGDASGSPSLNVSYRLLPRPVAATALPTSDTIHGSVSVTITSGQYKEVETAAIVVTESAEVLFTVERSATDGYLGEIGIIDAVAVLYSA
jgi:hypothetical protein